MSSITTLSTEKNHQRRQVLNIDRHVGKRIQQRRQELGMTQQDIAAKLEISYQQIQKYEKGHNRISAGKLWLIAQILKVEIGYFFSGMPDHCYPEIDSSDPLDNFPELSQLEGSSLRAAFSDLITSVIIEQKKN